MGVAAGWLGRTFPVGLKEAGFLLSTSAAFCEHVSSRSRWVSLKHFGEYRRLSPNRVHQSQALRAPVVT